MSVEIPGIKKEDINLEVEEGYLTIKVSSKEENTEENDSYIHQERSFGTFARRFYVGNITEKEISAKSANGILKIEILKNIVGNETKKEINIDWV